MVKKNYNHWCYYASYYRRAHALYTDRSPSKSREKNAFVHIVIFIVWMNEISFIFFFCILFYYCNEIILTHICHIHNTHPFFWMNFEWNGRPRNYYYHHQSRRCCLVNIYSKFRIICDLRYVCAGAISSILFILSYTHTHEIISGV